MRRANVSEGQLPRLSLLVHRKPHAHAVGAGVGLRHERGGELVRVGGGGASCSRVVSGGGRWSLAFRDSNVSAFPWPSASGWCSSRGSPLETMMRAGVGGWAAAVWVASASASSQAAAAVRRRRSARLELHTRYISRPGQVRAGQNRFERTAQIPCSTEGSATLYEYVEYSVQRTSRSRRHPQQMLHLLRSAVHAQRTAAAAAVRRLSTF